MLTRGSKMATSRSLLLLVLGTVFLSMAISISGDAGVAESAVPTQHEFEKEIADLKQQVSLLQGGLEMKDSSIFEKDSRIKSLELEVKNLHSHKQGAAGDAELKLEIAQAKVYELEKQVASYKEAAEKLKIEARTSEEKVKAVEEAALKHVSAKEKVAKALENLKTRLQKAERGLQIAEAGMLKAQLEAETKAKELEEAHKAWLPPWAATHAETLQKTASSHWSTHAEPVVKTLQRSASLKAADAHEYIKPHLDTFHTKVNPVIREKWQKLTLLLAPHLETVKKAGVASRDYIAPHVETVQKTVDPYVQIAREKSRPYIEQASTFVAPHLEKVNTIAGPHYRQALTTANSYHERVQSNLKEFLAQHEIFSSFATKETIWFLAAALLAFPFLAAFMVLRSLFTPKKIVHHKRHRSSHSSSSSTNKKPRRSKQVDKQVEK